MSSKGSLFPDYYSTLGIEDDENEIKSSEEIKQPDKEKESLNMEDFVISIRKKTKDTHKNQTFLIDIELLDKMKTIKQETGISLSSLANKALEVFLNNIAIKK